MRAQVAEDYWIECIVEAFNDARIQGTTEQIATIALSVQISSENYGTAHGYDCIPNPLTGENKQLRQGLAKERGKRRCPQCVGSGRVINHGPCHSSESECPNCRGEGRF